MAKQNGQIETSMLGRQVLVSMGLDDAGIEKYLAETDKLSQRTPWCYLGMAGEVIGVMVTDGCFKCAIAMNDAPITIEVFAGHLRFLHGPTHSPNEVEESL